MELLQCSSHRWRVHSVFRSACNLSLPEYGMVTLQGFGSSLSPISLILNEPLPDMCDVAPGTPVHFMDGQTLIIIGRHKFDASASISVDCRYRYPARPANYPRNCAILLNKMYSQSLDPIRDSVWDTIYAKCYTRGEQLLEAAVKRDTKAFKDAAVSLVGLGRGLTPSGDDILSGFCAVARFMPDIASLIRETYAAIIGYAFNGTTRVSFELLNKIYEGHYSTALSAVLNALYMDDEKKCQSACASLLNIGASTGRDSLYGILLALRLMRHTGSQLAVQQNP